MRLKYQLFLVLLAASAILIMLMFAISSWSFSRGFLSYLDNAEQRQLQPLLNDLVDRYERNDGWQWAEGNTPEWKQLLAEHGKPRRGRKRARGDARGGSGGAGGDSRGDAFSGGRTEPREDRFQRPPRGKPRFILADSDKRVLAGPPDGFDKVAWLPLTSDDQVVGFLGRKKLTRLNSRVDQAFEHQQRKSYALAGLAMVLLSAAMSIPLAGWLVKPLLRLNSAIAEVSQGNYSHRVKMRRKDEIADLASGVNSLATTLEANRDARRRWVAEISHELRTPVAVLQGELEAMQDGVRKMDVDSVDSIHTEVRKLAHLIDDLHQLSLSDVGALEYRMAPLCLADLVEAQIQIGSALLNEAGLSAQVSAEDKPYIINADERRLSQLISNLLQNSVRYTDAPGAIRVVLEKNDDSVRLLWEDSSPGVADSELEQLFEPLYRAEQSRSREFGGAGLGLSIATRIVQAHGGSIVASQSTLGGLQITIAVPSVSQL
jgi:two-component system sensor histidine kinase BaeS